MPNLKNLEIAPSARMINKNMVIYTDPINFPRETRDSRPKFPIVYAIASNAAIGDIFMTMLIILKNISATFSKK